MIKTAVGLPNTCSRCGRRCTGEWWAEHEDAARSGTGLCDECAQPAAPAVPVRYEPVGETLTRVQSPSATPRVPLMGKRGKGK
jgi:hypothetical protein